MVGLGDRRFEELYRDHFQRVASYLLARSDQVLTQDAVARTFEIAWRRIDDVPEDALPWLFGVARKVLADLRRSQGRSDALFERMASAVTNNDEAPDHAESTIQRLAALEALRSLSPIDREALLLIVWDGLSEKQAAKALGCSRGAFALRVHRARGRLRDAVHLHGQDARDRVPPPATVTPIVPDRVIPMHQAIEEQL
jgi:RNA polymerase sigma-70 factor (ECF subfamily)